MEKTKSFDTNQDAIFQKKHEQIVEDCLAYAQRYNQCGINTLTKGFNKNDYGLKLFQNVLKMLRLLQGDPGIEQMIGLTLNNISCFHKNNGDIIKAEVVLKRALRFQEGPRKAKVGSESQHAGIINIEDVDDTVY